MSFCIHPNTTIHRQFLHNSPPLLWTFSVEELLRNRSLASLVGIAQLFAASPAWLRMVFEATFVIPSNEPYWRQGPPHLRPIQSTLVPAAWSGILIVTWLANRNKSYALLFSAPKPPSIFRAGSFVRTQIWGNWGETRILKMNKWSIHWLRLRESNKTYIGYSL